ncbi:MAG TPA: RidA family protein [Candidatus Dormibacteraeota bacterium]|nr:RidA family protein [Candidatus Dormibacteraeota bacterium]
MQSSGPPRNLNPPDLAPARGFSHVTISGETVWIGGQTGTDSMGNLVEPDDVVAQFAQAIRNLGTALQAAGCEPSGTVKLTYYVTDLAGYKRNLSAIGSEFRKVFGRHYPASTLVEVRSLFDPNALVEIEAVAVRRS